MTNDHQQYELNWDLRQEYDFALLIIFFYFAPLNGERQYLLIRQVSLFSIKTKIIWFLATLKNFQNLTFPRKDITRGPSYIYFHLYGQT